MRTSIYNISFLCILVFLVPLSALSAQSPDPESILEEFRDSFNWIDTTAMHIEFSVWGGSSPDEAEVYNFDCYIDGDRNFRTTGTRQRVNPHTGKLSIQPHGGVLDEQYQTFLSTEDSGNLYLLHTARKNDDDLRVWEVGDEGIRLEQSLAVISGYAIGFSRQALYDLLTPDAVTIREEINEGVRSCVLEAITDQGSMEFWLSPDQNYVLQKCILTKEAGKDFDAKGSEIYEEVDFYSGEAIKRNIIEITVSETQSVDGRFIPRHMEYLYREEFADDGVYEHYHNLVISEVDLSPDFEALGAFNFVVPAGTSAYFRKKDGTVLSGFTWEDGKLVADMDADDLDDNIRTTIAQLKTEEGSKEPESAAGTVLQLRDSKGQKAFLRKPSTLLVRAAGVLLLLTCVSVGAVVYLKRKLRKNTTSGDDS
jgi:hypothetical protein